MATLKAKKLVEKEAYRIVEVIKERSDGPVLVRLDNGDEVYVMSSQRIEIGDWVITQSADDRYHCPASVVDDQYDIL